MKLQQRKNAGFTLIELMIVVAIIAIIASVAIPKLLSAKLAANESAAISTMRSISSAQAQFQSASAVDADSDGSGEYGWFGELSGTSLLRIAGGGLGVANNLTPSMLSAALGTVNASVITRSGYIFQMHLPTAAFVADQEAPAGGSDGGEGADACEIYWACYAWPQDAGGTGNRAFFVSQDGDILQTNNKNAATGAYVYDGAALPPAGTAAYTGAGDMSVAPAVGQTVNNALWTVLQ